jgi:hypothetical protein
MDCEGDTIFVTNGSAELGPAVPPLARERSWGRLLAFRRVVTKLDPQAVAADRPDPMIEVKAKSEDVDNESCKSAKYLQGAESVSKTGRNGPRNHYNSYQVSDFLP